MEVAGDCYPWLLTGIITCAIPFSIYFTTQFLHVRNKIREVISELVIIEAEMRWNEELDRGQVPQRH